MIEPTLSALGAKLVVASSHDENYPPENVIDGNSKTFWMTTGMFPQEFIICFSNSTSLNAVTVESYNVKNMKLEINTSETAKNFEPVIEKEFSPTQGHLQSNVISLNGTNATHLRFIIQSGYDHFVSVHKISVQT
ncbi:intraflagellar transport protein 25 homolog [Eucyclogobius newberryi]|uniref:intraflagellar transport protein 25 homolog n=1 Tax=Eucyclogobius newberryi TaxID=166745 RepID=UPI003B598269